MKKVLLNVMIFSSIVFSCKKEDAEPEVLKVYELTETIGGLTYTDLEKIATIWLIGTAPDKSAANDADGKLAATSLQPNPNVTILPFNFGGKSTRTLNIPASKPIYMPMLGYTYWFFDNDPCDPDFKPKAGQSVEAFLQPYIDELFTEEHTISAKLNGKDMVQDTKKFHAQSKAFDMLIPGEFQDPNCAILEKKAHVVSSSYSLFFKLPKGKHTIVYAGDFPNSDPSLSFETEVTYNLTVE
jgi:hypothetical protein